MTDVSLVSNKLIFFGVCLAILFKKKKKVLNMPNPSEKGPPIANSVY